MPSISTILERLRWKVGLGLVIVAAGFAASAAPSADLGSYRRRSLELGLPVPVLDRRPKRRRRPLELGLLARLVRVRRRGRRRRPLELGLRALEPRPSADATP